MNVALAIGRLTRDVEVRTTSTGKKVARFTLAVNRRGEGTDFIPCIAWDKTAEILEKYTSKGKLIGVTGRLVSGSYEKDGRKVNTLDLNVTEFDFCEGKKETVDRTERRRQEEKKLERYVDIPDTIDEELPFK